MTSSPSSTKSSPTNPGGIVPALTADTLAEVPANETFLAQLRTGVESIVSRYENTVTNEAYVAWTLPDLLTVAGRGDPWSAGTNGLLMKGL